MVACVASMVIRVYDMIDQLHCPLRIFIKIFGTCPLAHGQVIQASIRGKLSLIIYYSCNWLWDPTVRASSVTFESLLSVEKCGVRTRFSWQQSSLMPLSQCTISSMEYGMPSMVLTCSLNAHIVCLNFPLMEKLLHHV